MIHFFNVQDNLKIGYFRKDMDFDVVFNFNIKKKNFIIKARVNFNMIHGIYLIVINFLRVGKGIYGLINSKVEKKIQKKVDTFKLNFKVNDYLKSI